MVGDENTRTNDPLNIIAADDSHAYNNEQLTGYLKAFVRCTKFTKKKLICRADVKFVRIDNNK